MKFMKLGTRPDTFYTEEATRNVISDVASDLTIQINNTTYHLHKFPLLPKCGLLQTLCSDFEEPTDSILELHDTPGGEPAFELCAKFCYGITINLCAHNFVPAFCAAKFLRMTEAVDRGNFVQKLEAFFSSCLLQGWKDSIIALQATGKLPDWSEILGIVRRCLDSVIDKILTPHSKVTWSYTYTRAGYNKKRHHTVPRDWWTEDISELEIDLFRCILAAIRSSSALPPALIGEALHVYATKWLFDAFAPAESSVSQEPIAHEKTRILDTIVSLIPTERGSVSIGFLFRLLGMGNLVRVSPATKTELIRRCGLQLEEATLDDLRVPEGNRWLDVELVRTVVESFLFRRRRELLGGAESGESVSLIRKVGKLIDCYLRVMARNGNVPVEKVVALAGSLPEYARADHDELYKAINTYLKEHPELSKAEKKQLCRTIDCRKLSPAIRSHAVGNENLPLRTVVQVLYCEQEIKKETKIETKGPTSLKLGPDKESDPTRPMFPGHRKNSTREEITVIEPRKERETRKEGTSKSRRR